MKEFINNIFLGDCQLLLSKLPDNSVHCIVTSPPYWGLRNYGEHVKSKFPEITFTLFGMPVTVPEWEGQLGLEPNPMLFVAHIVHIFRDARRVLRKDGTLWMNFGDSYIAQKKAGFDPKYVEGRGINFSGPNRLKQEFLKPKDLCGIPWMVAFALRDDGWYLRQDIIWSKKNCMPESVNDRCTKSHEYIFLLSKTKKYFFDAESIKQPAKDGTEERYQRGRTENHKRVNGAPWQKPHTLHQPKSNQKYAWGRAIDGSIDDYRKGSGDVIRKSGNKARKQGIERGCPEGTGSNVCSSVPWEGSMANKRSVWEVPTRGYSEAHFATYPPDLIVDCIKAGCPEFVCSCCGSPFIPIHSKVLVPTIKAAKTFVIDERDYNADKQDQGSNRQKDGHKQGHAYQSTLIGYEKSCNCNWAKPEPGIVLDPFGGRNTTGVVSRKLNRNYIASELNPDYIPIANKYTLSELGLFN